MAGYIWTAEQRAAAAQRARKRALWRHSTGPKTVIGKKRASMNAMKHGMRSRAVKNLRDFMRKQRDFLKAYRYFTAKALKEKREKLKKPIYLASYPQIWSKAPEFSLKLLIRCLYYQAMRSRTFNKRRHALETIFPQRSQSFV